MVLFSSGSERKGSRFSYRENKKRALVWLHATCDGKFDRPRIKNLHAYTRTRKTKTSQIYESPTKSKTSAEGKGKATRNVKRRTKVAKGGGIKIARGGGGRRKAARCLDAFGRGWFERLVSKRIVVRIDQSTIEAMLQRPWFELDRWKRNRHGEKIDLVEWSNGWWWSWNFRSACLLDHEKIKKLLHHKNHPRMPSWNKYFDNGQQKRTTATFDVVSKNQLEKR